MKSFILSLPIGLLLCACSSRHSVIVNTGTVLGVEVAQNPTSQAYQAKIGYARAEFAYVPSNRAANEKDKSTRNGAKDTTDVIMEIRLNNILTGGGVYQRLAIGPNAVNQPGAAFMFAKDSDGSLSSSSAEAVSKAFSAIPVKSSEAIDAIIPLSEAYRNSDSKTSFDEVAVKLGYSSFDEALDKSTTTEDTNKIAEELKKKGLLK